ncbi:winged helix-turn-helix transcriptional regulator [Streptomyces sp. NPDC091292]|uniref:winged helix-turn-helix transcriptional regulator n=1 Tax=Streptomyces sp. NPDC091292 TaxID=3365991 RepID=UPI0037FED286
MAITGLPPNTDADIARVTEALAMITPRWHVRILLTVSGRPLRYSAITDKLPWLQNGQLAPKLMSLCDAGLIQRTQHSPRHVTYGHTDRGAALLPILPVIATWAEEHLEKADRPLRAIEQVEDSLTLLTRRHAAAILWVLKSRGEASGRVLARAVMPGNDWTNIYPPLRTLVADGLVETDGTGQPYRLAVAGDDLGSVFAALSAWSAGQSLAHAVGHPVWGRRDTASPLKGWVSNKPRQAAPSTVPAPWRHRDLFSHVAPARTAAALSAGGPRR